MQTTTTTMTNEPTCDGDDCDAIPVYFRIDGNWCDECMEKHDPGFYEQVQEYSL